MMKRKALFLALALLAVFAVAGVNNCTTNQGGSDAGPGRDGSGGGDVTNPDGSSADVVIEPPKDLCVDKDSECAPDKICDFKIGKCIPGLPCPDGHSNCAYLEDYCGPDGVFCYCDLDGKTCKRSLMICETCNADKECGDNKDSTGREDRCIAYPDGKRCGKECGAIKCPPGFECDTKSGSPAQCRPARANAADPYSCQGVNICQSDGDCNDPTKPRCLFYLEGSTRGVCASYCISDTDCGRNPTTKIQQICNSTTGTCYDGCLNANGTPNDNKCSNDMKCHSNGRCDDPCTIDKDCTGMFGKKVDWICNEDNRCQFCIERDESGGCKVKGCASDGDCPNRPTYCDRETHVCQDGKCRNTQDCASTGDVCENGTCRRLDCLENGGADSCRVFQFCCGENKTGECKDNEGTVVKKGDCFTASTPPYCTKCEKNEDCSADAGYQDICLEFQDRDGGTAGKFCTTKCVKGETGWCPAGHQCSEIKDQNGAVVATSCIWPRCTTWNPSAADGGTGGDK
ncbi:MAG: hypothetical protein WC889_14250 [Myxococcota bacterium]|jgi:hypothetical protein